LTSLSGQVNSNNFQQGAINNDQNLYLTSLSGQVNTIKSTSILGLNNVFTGSNTFTGSGVSGRTVTFNNSSGGNGQIFITNNTGNASYNPICQTGDAQIIYNNNAANGSGTPGLNICAWTGTSNGIKLSPTLTTIYTPLTVTGALTLPANAISDSALSTNIPLKNGNNAYTGTNTFNTTLPTSSLFPSNSNELSTKGYTDQAIANLLGSDNSWSGVNSFVDNTNIGNNGVVNPLSNYLSSTGTKYVGTNPISGATNTGYTYYLFTNTTTGGYLNYLSSSVPDTYTMYFVVIGGGGGGGYGTANGGGGGGGGAQIISGTFTVNNTVNKLNSIIVGAGGNGGAGFGSITGTNGGQSGIKLGSSLNYSYAAPGLVGGDAVYFGGNGANSGTGATGGQGGYGTAGSQAAQNGVVVSNSGSGGGGGFNPNNQHGIGGVATYTFGGDGSTYAFCCGGDGGYRVLNSPGATSSTYGSGGGGGSVNKNTGNASSGINGCVLIYYLSSQTVTTSKSSLNIYGNKDLS
jgi:hypothetical protein